MAPIPRARRVSLAAVMIFAVAGPVPSAQQQGRGNAGGVPRTVDGQPDLEGVWENNSATPLERPRQPAGKSGLSDDELASFERRARALFGPEAEAVFGDALYAALLTDTRPGGPDATGTYSQNWLPDRYFEHRTTLIEDPADGRLPALTPAGTAVRASAVRFGSVGASAQDMTLQDRCIHDGTLACTFTIDDPTMWTRPWAAVINWKRSQGELYESACHEGNCSLRGMLSAARADEAAGRR